MFFAILATFGCYRHKKADPRFEARVGGGENEGELGFGESGDAGEVFSFKELQAGSSASGDEGHVVGYAELDGCGDRVASTYDANTVACSNGFGELLGASGKAVDFENLSLIHI